MWVFFAAKPSTEDDTVSGISQEHIDPLREAVSQSILLSFDHPFQLGIFIQKSRETLRNITTKSASKTVNCRTSWLCDTYLYGMISLTTASAVIGLALGLRKSFIVYSAR